MARLLGKIIGLTINIIMIPIVLILAIPMGILKARKTQKSRLLFTGKEQSLLAKAQRTINMDASALLKPDRDLLEVARCIENARCDYQTINSRERFDASFSDFIIPRINLCHIEDWDNVIGFFELAYLSKPKQHYESIGDQEPEWMHELWKWAVEHEIESYNIPREKNELLNLEHLSFGSISYLGREKFSLLPREVGRLRKLTSLELGSVTHPEIMLNKLTELPKEIGDLTALTRLYLQFNRLSELPTQIGNLKNLRELKLGGNNLSTLPDEIGNLHKLEILTIWNNNLKHIPKEIGCLTNLKGLSLWGNPLGKLPEEITNLTALKNLELCDMPNLVLSPRQRIWLETLAENGCEILLDDTGTP